MLGKPSYVWRKGALWTSGVLRRFMSVSSRDVADAAAKDGELRVFIVSGEVSGDTIGGRLMASLKKISPSPVRFYGVGGSMMSQHGLKSLFPMENLAVMGIWELLPHIRKLKARLNEAVKAALSFKPHVVVTVDSKGFSFRFLKALRALYTLQQLDSPLHFHYVAPSFWAWKGGEAKLKRLSHFVDHIFCILPFEEQVCRANGLSATFVGHPVIEDCSELIIDKDYVDWKVQKNSASESEIPSGGKVLTLLPGSRLQEVTRMLPIFLNAVELLKGSFPELSVVINVASNRHVENYVGKMVQNCPVPVVLIPGNSTQLKYAAFDASSVALCTSGTVAVELQLAKLPCVVAYRAHILTEWLIRYKAKVSHISLPNILLDSPVIPEALFRRCTPQRLALLVSELIDNEAARRQQIDSAQQVIRLLCPPENDVVQYECNWRGTLPPSMIAASTILCSKMQR